MCTVTFPRKYLEAVYLKPEQSLFFGADSCSIVSILWNICHFHGKYNRYLGHGLSFFVTTNDQFTKIVIAADMACSY